MSLEAAKRTGMSARDELGGGKTHGDVGTLGVVFDEVHDAVEATVHGAAVVVFVAEVLAHRSLLILRDVYGVVDELIDTFVLGSRDGHHRQTEDLFHLVHQDAAAVVAHLVHHVES